MKIEDTKKKIGELTQKNKEKKKKLRLTPQWEETMKKMVTYLDLDADFESQFSPTDMKCLALVSHNNMKHERVF